MKSKNLILFLLLNGFFLSSTVLANQKKITGYNAYWSTALKGYNRMRLDGVSAYECKATCDKESWCKSFDFHEKKFSCDLSDRSAHEFGLVNSTDYTHYAKKINQRYSYFPFNHIKGHNSLKLKNVSRNACMISCSKKSWCKSIDYHNGKNICDLSDVNQKNIKNGLSGTGMGAAILDGFISGGDPARSPYDHYEKNN